MACYMTYEHARIELPLFVLFAHLQSTEMNVYFLEIENSEWDTSIDDNTLSQIGQLLEDQDDVFNGITELTLTQTAELYDFN